MRGEYGLELMGKIGVNNTYSIGVTQQVMDTYHPETISDLIPIAGQLRFGGGAGLLHRRRQHEVRPVFPSSTA